MNLTVARPFVMVLALACASIQGLAQESADDRKKESKRLGGVWQLVQWRIDGDEIQLPKEGGKIVIEDGGFTMKLGEKAVGDGKLSLNPGVTPRAVDVKYSDLKYEGLTNLGIYELKSESESEQLWMAVARAGAE